MKLLSMYHGHVNMQLAILILHLCQWTLGRDVVQVSFSFLDTTFTLGTLVCSLLPKPVIIELHEFGFSLL